MKRISKGFSFVLGSIIFVGLFAVTPIIASTNSTVFSSAEGLSINNVTLTDEQVTQNIYNAYTSPRIDEIYATPNTEYTGTAYYVSSSEGNDSNDGLSPEKPFKTITKVRYLIEGDVIKEGSVVYFKRGDEWRGETLYLPSKDCDITITAYGTGPKPVFNGSRDNYAKESYWEEVNPTKHIYRFVPPSGTAADYWQDTHWDVGAIVLTGQDGNIEDSPKCFLRNNSDNTKTNKTTGKIFFSYADLDDLHFFHDTDKNGAVNINGDCELYLRCDAGNPGIVFKDIEFLEGRGLIQGGPHVKAPTIDNIEFRNCSSHAISITFSRNLTVKNCVFNWVGGATQYDKVRYGNGIEIWGSAENFTVDNCYFSQIYDAAVTFQFSRDNAESGDVNCKNISFTNNVMEYCNYSVEYFLRVKVKNSDGEEVWSDSSAFENFTISGNHMWYAGYGFCEQRSDKGCDAHIQSWSSYNKCLGGFNVSDNVFAVARNCLIETRYGALENARPVYSNNTYIQYKNRNETGNHYLGNVGSVSDAPLTVAFDDNVRSTISNWGDTDAMIVWIDNTVQPESTPPAIKPTVPATETTVTVTKPVEKKTTLTLTRTSATIYVKGSTAVRATVRNGRGKTTYRSSNTRVARVDSKGKITALKAGRAKITVTNNKVSKVLTVKVLNPRLNATGKTLKVKRAFTLRIIGRVGRAKFSTSNRKVATINSKGKITAKKKGTAIITVKTNGITLKCKVKVK